MLRMSNDPIINPRSFIMMAPMEGVIDATMRDMFSAIGGIDRMVTEFVRVSGQVLPARVFKKYCPELDHHSRTPSGTEVYVQLLGDKPELMGRNAAKVAELGAKGIDLNFGCPAKTVNHHGGGSVLLQEPEKIYHIIHAVRKNTPNHIPVTAKIRLGYKDSSLALDIANAVEAGGACELIVHGRTKVQGYKPPAYWHDIGRIKNNISIPVTANGEIWTTHDLQQCMMDSGCNRIMLGRGLVACPDLALFAKNKHHQAFNWLDIIHLLEHYYCMLQSRCDARYQNSLIKQWLIYLRNHYGEAYLFFEAIKRLRQPDEMLTAILKEKRRLLKIQPRKITQLGGLLLKSSDAL